MRKSNSDVPQWLQKLQDLAKHARLPKKEQNEITFNILRLDPLSRYVQASFENVTDQPDYGTPLKLDKNNNRNPRRNCWLRTPAKPF